MPVSTSSSGVRAIYLYIQFLNFARVLGQEYTAALRILVFHQFCHQLCSQDTIFHRHALQDAACWIKCGIAQLFRVHFAKTFEAFELQILRISVCTDKLVTFLIVEQPDYFSLIFDRIERRAGDIDMTALDQIAEVLMEQRQKQALNMQAIHVGISGDNDTIKFESADIKDIARARAQDIDNRANLFVFDDTFQIRLRHVQRLALQFEHGLKVGEASLPGTAAGGVALNDEEFCSRSIGSIAT